MSDLIDPIELASKRIMVTGGAGFLGSHVVERLRAAGCTSISIPRSREHDLREQADVRRLFAEVRPEIVIHLAGKVGGIEHTKKHPGEFFYDNLMMGVLTMEEARRTGVEKYVAAVTVCAYPRDVPTPFREDDLWDGYPEETNAPYGLAKKMALVQASGYRQEYGLHSICLLPANLYGPGDNFAWESSHVIPALIRKCEDAKALGLPEIEVWGTGNATREFLYAPDCAEAIVLATQRYDDTLPVNLGTGHEVSIRELVELVREATGFTGGIRWNTDYPDGQPHRRLDVTRAQQLFGFSASTALRDGLRQTVEWWNTHGKVQAAASDSGVRQ